MIVDLVRNDLARVCEPGTIEVPALLRGRGASRAWCTWSRPSADGCAPGAGWPELLAATFPPGSVTGAPKSTALQAIADLEPAPRGPYCGAIGWVDADAGQGALAVGIRTFWAERASAPGAALRHRRRHHLGLGPAAEWDETELKAARLVGLASGRVVP